jgi:hypothetical protein
VSRPVARYRSSRRYLLFALTAACGAVFCAWIGIQWGLTWTVASALFGLTAAATLALTLRPAIEIHETHLQIGRRMIFWNEIRRLDRTNWSAPLLVRLTLADNSPVMLLHAGDTESSASLLRHLCRYSRSALLDGVPYSQFWGEPPASQRKQLPPSPRYPLLRPEDEEEVERLFQRLKTVGRLDQKSEDR